ncbi:MAG: glycosyltransferase, partial [Propioniciclava sp.]
MGVDATVDQRIVAVVVAWNRRDLLAENLAGLAAQTRPPDAVVVIDNASTDDSAALAARHPVVTEVVSLPTNTGGAGGFAAGIARAIIAHGAEAVWIMDDDTVPT